MSYSSRVYRQRNAHTHDESKKEGFFSKQHDIEQGKNKGLKVNEPGDSYEKEADAVANAVVNHPGAKGKSTQQKASGSVQRLSTSAEEDKLSTNDARMKQDKDVQRAPMAEEKEKEKVQKKDEPKKEEEKVQKKDEPKKEEEKVMKKDQPKKEEEKVQKKEQPRKEEEKPLQRKPEGNSTAAPEIAADIRQHEGRGEPLPPKVLLEMNAGLGKDFSDVRIHNDQDAAAMSDELEAQAFTHKKDIYFNSGKFDPYRSNGKFLLAHELAHVVQQQGSEMKAAGAGGQPAAPASTNDAAPVSASTAETNGSNGHSAQ